MIQGTGASLAIDDAARLRSGPATSWGAILAGTAVAISLSLVLVILGAGLGFASVSPWEGRGMSAGGLGVASTIWLIVTQWLSAAAGGYVTGRLRYRWLATHVHEVFFRDTAHGLVTWAVATLIVATLVTGSATALLGGGTRTVGGLAHAGVTVSATGAGSDTLMHAPQGPEPSNTSGGYQIDKLLRANATGPSSAEETSPRGADPRAEVMHIGTQIMTTGTVSDEDRTYLVKLVASRNGVSNDEAQKRVDVYIQSVQDTVVKTKAAADEARKAAATAALYTALALLIGAFITSVAAAIGGRLRDEHL
jgi:hypothetical protein